MTKTIGKYDFVKTKGSNSYYFIRDIYDDKATIVGMKLSENKDTIMFYSKQVPVDELTYVTEIFCEYKWAIGYSKGEYHEWPR